MDIPWDPLIRDLLSANWVETFSQPKTLRERIAERVAETERARADAAERAAFDKAKEGWTKRD